MNEQTTEQTVVVGTESVEPAEWERLRGSAENWGAIGVGALVIAVGAVLAGVMGMGAENRWIAFLVAGGAWSVGLWAVMFGQVLAVRAAVAKMMKG